MCVRIVFMVGSWEDLSILGLCIWWGHDGKMCVGGLGLWWDHRLMYVRGISI